MAGFTLAILLVHGAASAAGEPDPADCTAYYESRVADALGCCGDVTVGYSGNKDHRATAALKEVGIALQQRCLDRKSMKYFAIMLDRAGAHLMRAQALMSGDASDPPSRTAIDEAVGDADAATKILQAFIKEHPHESSQVWFWIASALNRAGHPWVALSFLSHLDPRCCDRQELTRFQGDLLFSLDIAGAASKKYAQWLGRAGPDDFCGSQISLNNASELRRRGFQISSVAAPVDARCTVLSDWAPYVRFPLRVLPTR